MTSVPNLSEKLRMARLERGLSQAEVAHRAETSQSQIARIESGRQDPGLRTWERVFRTVGLELTTTLTPEGADREPNPHRVHELRSLVLHAIIAEKARTDPRIIARARERVANWERDGGPTHPPWTAHWRDLLDMDDELIIAALARDDELMRDMRQSSPFAGAVTDAERLGVIRALASMSAVTDAP